jgi:hypothetical protein
MDPYGVLPSADAISSKTAIASSRRPMSARV